MTKRFRFAALTAVVALTGGLFGVGGQARAAQCDRACLKGMVDSYLAALVAHDPSRAPVAKHYKFVENLKPMKVGEGLWKTATAVPTTFAIYVPDPVSEQVGFIGIMQRDNKPIELALRLKVVNGKITEMEHLIAADLTKAELKNLQTPRPVFLASVPKDQRTPRKKMLKIGASYYAALVTNKGTAAPFDDADCERHENGMITARPPQDAKPGATGRAAIGTLGCTKQIDSGMFTYIKRIEPRRVWIADPQTGLVFGLSQFRHPMKEKSEKITGVPGVTTMPMKFDPFDLPAAHIFKISGGKIHEIEAMGFTAPYNSPTGW